MQYSLAYGRERLTVELPEKNVVKVLKIQSAAALEDPIDAVFDVLEEPIEAEPLAAIAEGKKSACVVVCDGTQPAPNPVVLPPILQTLEDAGIDVPKITILIASGLRRNSTIEERTEIIGEDIMLRKFKVSDHSFKKLHQHEYLGVTKSGTPIWIDRRYLEAEVKILTGMIEPHSISGFCGGRESICPGIAATETVAPCFSPKQLEHENVRPGCLEDNPVHAEQMEIARKADCDFIVNVILNQDRKISKVVGGHLNYAFLNGVAIARKCLSDTVENQVDVVITSGGGLPFDRTFQQSIRGMAGALDILKPGGTIIIASSCSEGIGSEDFREIAEQFSTIDDFMTAITYGEQSFVDQWQLVELAKVLRKGKVKMVSDGIPAETLQKFFVVPYASVEEAVADALKEYGENASMAVIPAGPSVLALAKHREPEVKKPEPKSAEPPKTADSPKTIEPKKTVVKKTEQPEPEPVVSEPDEVENVAVKKPTVKKSMVEKSAAEKADIKKATKKTAVKKTVIQKTETKKAATKKAVKKATKKS